MSGACGGSGGWLGFGVGGLRVVRGWVRGGIGVGACGWPQRRVLAGTRVPLATHRRT